MKIKQLSVAIEQLNDADDGFNVFVEVNVDGVTNGYKSFIYHDDFKCRFDHLIGAASHVIKEKMKHNVKS